MARQLYNALLGEGLRRFGLLRQSRLYADALHYSRTRPEERALLFSLARRAVGFTETALSRYATSIHASWVGQHVDAVIGQTLARRAFGAVNRMALGRARKVRFKGKRGLHHIASVEGKSNAAGLRWRNGALMWGSVVLPMVKGADRDPVIAWGLGHRVKYVRLVRRHVRRRWRWAAQLVCEGVPYRKLNPKTGTFLHPYGTEVQGLDLGPSTLAAVGHTAARLELFAAEVVRDHAAIRLLQRHLDRQRRASNPNCYDNQGRAKKGSHPVQRSRRQRQTESRLRDLGRREAAHRRGLHGRLANQLLTRGVVFKTERLSYRAWQKMFGRSVGLRAPQLFLAILTRKAESAGGQVIEFSTRTTALSQQCLCGDKHPKRLAERVHTCPRGSIAMQRDLFSAYLARFVEEDALPIAAARASWPGAEPLLWTAWEQATANEPARGRGLPSSFGRLPVGRSRSGSSEKICATAHAVGNPAVDDGNGVALSQEGCESPDQDAKRAGLRK